MLVLARRESESIVINGDIIIKVIAVRGKKVRLGVEAPRRIPVHRSELDLHADEATFADHHKHCADG